MRAASTSGSQGSCAAPTGPTLESLQSSAARAWLHDTPGSHGCYLELSMAKQDRPFFFYARKRAWQSAKAYWGDPMWCALEGETPLRRHQLLGGCRSARGARQCARWCTHHDVWRAEPGTLHCFATWDLQNSGGVPYSSASGRSTTANTYMHTCIYEYTCV